MEKESRTGKKSWMSEQTIKLIQEYLDQADGITSEAERRSKRKEIAKSKKHDVRENTINRMKGIALSSNAWQTMKSLRVGYKPHTYSRKTKQGEHISLCNIAEESAQHLAKEQWGVKDSQAWEAIPKTRLFVEELNIRDDKINLLEVKGVIKKFKKRKAPGPDGLSTELFKQLNNENMWIICDILNKWFMDGEDPHDSVWEARIALIYKKGDTENLENYRPIALLNTIYKIYAAVLKSRLEQGLEKHIRKTQFGFRKDKSTADAIHCIRRIIDYAEQTNNKTILLLLDWAKAFDTINHKALLLTLERARVPDKLVKAIGQLYKKPQFQVQLDGQESEWHRQEQGIRQGCPMSPYLFILLMTALFIDINDENQMERDNLVNNRIPNTNFDEVLYADDTICISSSEEAIENRLKQIIIHGARYGLHLNMKKCEVLGNVSAHIKYPNGEEVTQKDTVEYLGAMLNIKGDIRKEVQYRIAMCGAVLKKLDIFWLHTKCPLRWKLLAHDAIIRSKLLYGLDSAELTPAILDKIDVFQLKGIRKIMKWKTTFVERGNTNERLLRKANQLAQAEGKKYIIKRFSEAYKEAKAKRGIRTLKKTCSDPVKYTTLNSEDGIWDFSLKAGGKLRIGKPKNKWAAEALSDIWNIAKEQIPELRSNVETFNTAKTWSSGNANIIRNLQALLTEKPGAIERAVRAKYNIRMPTSTAPTSTNQENSGIEVREGERTVHQRGEIEILTARNTRNLEGEVQSVIQQLNSQTNLANSSRGYLFA